MESALSCPFCDSGGVVCFEKRGIAIAECTNCDHRYADYTPPDNHVAEVYGDAYFAGGAGEYADYDLEAEMLAKRGAWYGKLLARHETPGALLDVGAASGALLSGLASAGWQGVGIEPNPMMAERARTRGLDVRTGSLEDAELGGPYAAITFVQVLPHLHSIGAALERAVEITAEGGLWLIETWNRSSLVARTLGERWHEYNPPSVLHWFSRDTLPALLAPFGLEQIAGGRPPKSILGQHAKSLLENDGGGPLGAAARLASRAIPERLEIPYPGDDVMWQLYRRV